MNIFRDESIKSAKESKIISLLEELEVFTFERIEKIRLGNNEDGGYILVDLGIQYDALYSYGIGTNYSFDKDFVDKFNVKSYMFDPSIEDIPIRDNLFIFKREKVKEIKDECSGTIPAHIAENNHLSKNRLFLKMDIEGDEWKVLHNMENEHLRKFAQVVIEFHDLNSVKNIEINSKIEVLRKINTDFVLLHAHANNFSHILKYKEYKLVNVLELTFVRKDLIKKQITRNRTKFPLNIDYPNYPFLKEIILDFYPFVTRM
jgi:hypothetical protein